MSLFGENLGRDDQYIFARGGGYDVFKVQFYSDRMPHNLSFNALTPLNWPGSSLQPAPAGAYPPATNPATWNNFDYGLQRNTIGGNVEVNAKSPFFFRVDYNEVQTTGIRPSSGQLGTGSGNGLIEFGLPTDYTTKNSMLEGGYKGKNWNVKLGFLDSKFSSNSRRHRAVGQLLHAQRARHVAAAAGQRAEEVDASISPCATCGSTRRCWCA